MQVFNLKGKQISSLKEKPFKLEKDIQTLFEANLEELMGLQFIASEFRIKANRFDTVAFDEEMKSFVIIEYKRSSSFSVIDQGVSYLNLMLEYKADFIVEYNERQNKSIKRNEIDWSQSRVIFVSPSFTDFQKQASNFRDLPIELWEIKQFENDVIVINPIKKSKSAPTLNEVRTEDDSPINKVSKEIKVYSEDDHLINKSDEIRELYETFKEAIFKLNNNIDIKPKKQEIGFTNDGKIFTDICIQKSSLKLWINLKKGELDDPKGLARDMHGIGHWGNGDYELIITDTKDLEYIMSLVKQVL